MDEEYYRPTREERKEVTLGIRAPVGIRNGRQCANLAQDQQHIMFLLNKIPNTAGGTLYSTGPTNFKAARDGYCDPGLSKLISVFQQRNNLKADGVVDPDGPTLKTLNKLSTGGVPSRPTGSAALSPPQVDALNELLDICHGLTTHTAADGQYRQFREKIAAVAGNIEGEMAKLGIPNRQRRPSRKGVHNLSPALLALPQSASFPIVNPAAIAALIGAAYELSEFLLMALAAVVAVAALYLLLRELLKTLQEMLRILAKTMIVVLTEIKMLVARAHASTRTNRCRDEDFTKFYEAANIFTRALQSGHATKSVLQPVIRAWWSALQKLLFCMDIFVVRAILKLFGTMLSFGVMFWEFILPFLE